MAKKLWISQDECQPAAWEQLPFDIWDVEPIRNGDVFDPEVLDSNGDGHWLGHCAAGVVSALRPDLRLPKPGECIEIEMSMDTKMTRDEWLAYIGEAIHAGLRKVTDSSASVRAYNAISEMPDEEWKNVLDFALPKPGECIKIEAEPTCEWRLDDEDTNTWKTACGHVFLLMEGTPADNHMAQCCYCGKKIVQPRMTRSRKDDSDYTI